MASLVLGVAGAAIGPGLFDVRFLGALMAAPNFHSQRRVRLIATMLEDTGNPSVRYKSCGHWYKLLSNSTAGGAMRIVRALSASQFAAIILFFFLPFINVSCSNMVAISLTGQQLATGTEITMPNPMGQPQAQQVAREPSATFALAAAVAGVVLSLLGGQIFRILCITVGGIGALLLFYLKSVIDNDFATQAVQFGGLVQLDYKFGFWASVFLFVAAAGTNIYSLLQMPESSGKTKVQQITGIIALILIAGAGIALYQSDSVRLAVSNVLEGKNPQTLSATAPQPPPANMMNPTNTELAQQLRECNGTLQQGVSNDLKISGCTAAIQSGQLNTENQAIAFTNRGGAYGDLGQYARAIQDFNQAISLKSDYAEAFSGRGFAYAKMGQYKRAIPDFDQMISLKPGSAEAYYLRGSAYGALEDYTHAFQDFDQVIRLKPDLPEAFTFRGGAYAQLGQFARAIQDYDQAIQLKPDDAEAFNSRCFARAVLNQQLDDALADCNESLRLRPNDAKTTDSLAFLYFRKGDFANAITNYDAALATNPKLTSSLYVRGVAKLRTGDIDAGNADIAEAKAIDPKVADRYAGFGVTP